MNRAISNRAHRSELTRVAVAVLAAVAVALGWCGVARANFKSLAQRLPASTNTVVAINVEKVLSTPYAKAEWTPTAADAWARQPVMVPPGSTRLLMGAELRTDIMEPLWEMCLMEMSKMPSIKALAAAEGGHIDRVWDKDAVASPINAYFIPLDGTTLASITPANRSAISKWVRTATTTPQGNVTSDYIRGVLADLSDKTDIVMALDLEGAFGVPRIRRWLDDNDIKEVKPDQAASVAAVLGTMKGITLHVSIDQDATGRAVVAFDRDVTVLAPSAKPIMLGALRTAGMRIDDVEQWNFTVAGNQVVTEGQISTAALRNLLGVVQSPIPAATVAQQPGGGLETMPTDPAQASQRYFKMISASLDNFRAGTSATETATWARGTAKRIEQLPILNVDPQLVQWGSLVSLKLKQAAGGMAMAQTQINSRVAGVMDPAFTDYTDNEGNVVSGRNQGDMENARRQRRQAAMEQRAQAQEQALQIINEIAETRPQIRAAMVEKYKVEF